MSGAVAVAKETSPYRGIHPFRYADRAYFCGRSDLIKELESNVFLHRLVILFGKSGAGKSSVVNAGLVPFLENQGLKCERLRIGTSPDCPIQLERIVGDNDVLQPSIFDESEEPDPSRFDQTIPLSMEALFSRVKTYAELNRTISTPTLTLIFDQFEELFTRFEFAKINSGPDKKPWQRRLTDTIVTLAMEGSRHLRLLLVIREDFLADLEVMARDYPRVMDYRVRLNYLTGPEAISAILDPLVDPAAKTNRFPCVIDPALAGVIVKDIARAQSSASAADQDLSTTVLQHQASQGNTELTEEAVIPPTQVQIVCSELWDSYANKMQSIGIDQYYREKGGLQGILDSWFESQLQKLDKVDLGLRRPAIIILQSLITDLGTRDVVSEKVLRDLVLRRPVVEPEFSAALNSLANDLHLVETSSQRGTQFYEVASEYLIPSVQSKGKELEKEEAAEKAAKAAKEAAEKQAQETKEAAEKAARDLELKHLQEIAAVAKENAETQQRLAAEQKQRAEEKAATATKMKRLVAALAVACAASLILAVLFAYAWRLAHSRELAYEAYKHESDNPGLSTRLALKSIDVTWWKPSPVSQAALESALARTHVLPLSATGSVKSISISGDLRHVAVVDAVGNIEVNEAAEQPNGDSMAYTRSAGAQNGSESFVSNINSSATPISVESQKIDPGCQSPPAVALVSGSGDRKVSASLQHVTLLEATWLQPLATFCAADVALNPIFFFLDKDGKYSALGSPKPVLSYDGQFLAFTQSGHEQDVVLWETESAQGADASQHSKRESLHGITKVLSLAFSSPERGLLAVGGFDGTVKLWDIRTSQPPGEWKTLDTGREAVVAIAFSPNAKRLAIATTDGASGKVYLWDAEKMKLSPPTRLSAAVSAMIFSDDGMLLATAENGFGSGSQQPTTEEKFIKVWYADTLKLRNNLPLSPGSKAVSFSGNGKILAAASQNGAASFVKVWNIETTDSDKAHEDKLVYKGAVRMEAISGIAMNGDGHQLLMGSNTGTLTKHFLFLQDQIKQATQMSNKFTPDVCKNYSDDPDCNDF
jgi:WD40 repeat protein